MELRKSLIGIATGGSPNLLEVLERITYKPHRAVRVERPVVPLYDLTNPSGEGFLDVLHLPNGVMPAPCLPVHFRWRGRPYWVRQVVDVRTYTTTDTYPNRYVKMFLTRYRRTLRTCEPSTQLEQIVRVIDRTLSSEAFRLASPLNRIAANDPVLQKDPLYREVLRASVSLGEVLRRRKKS